MKSRNIVMVAMCAIAVLTGCNSNPASKEDDPEDKVVRADSYEPDDTRSSAKSIHPDSGSQMRTLKRGDTDWVSFSAVSGKSYRIFTEGKTDTRIKVYGEGSSPLLEGDDSPNDINALVVFNCTQSNTYHISVYGNDETATGSYELGVASSIGPDTFEPDSLPEGARLLSTSIQTRSITAGDTDWVRCLVISDNDTILLIASGTCRVSMVLYDRDTVKKLTSASPGDSTTELEYIVSDTGTYFLRVVGASASATGSYKLSMRTSSLGTLVTGDAYEDDDTRSEARLLPGNSALQQRSFTEGDTDWVILPVVEGRQYTIAATKSSVRAILYAKDQTVLQGPSNQIDLNSSATDTVYVKLYPTVSTVFSYELIISVMLQPGIPDEFEDDDSRDEANCAPSDSFIQDRTLAWIDSISDTDWVAFPAMAGKEYIIQAITSNSVSLYMYLYGKGSTEHLDYISNSSNAITYTPAASDTLFLEIYRSTKADLAYTLTVTGEFINDTYEPDSSRTTAGKLSTAPQNRILLPNDTDWVEYTAQPGDSIVVLTSGTTDTKLALFSSSGSTPMKESDRGEVDGNAIVSWKSASGGQFYIRVTGQTTSTSGSYVLQALSTLSGTLVGPDTLENDNSREDARIISDSVLSGEVHSLHVLDTDWVAVPAVAGGQYTVSISGSSGSLSLCGYTSDDSLFGSRTITTSGSIVFAPLDNDTLYYRVTSSSTIQQYTLSINGIKPPPDDEYEDDDVRENSRVITDSVLSGEVHSLSFRDTDWVAFPVVAGGQYTVTAGGSSSSLYMYVFDSNDSLLASRTGTTSPSISITPQKDDTLYYRLTSTTMVPSYTISMSRVVPPEADEYEPDNTRAQARTILDTIVSNQIHTLGYRDTDWVALPVAAGGRYTVTVSGGSSTINLYVYNSKDSLITSQSISTSASIAYTAPRDDTLYYRFNSAYTIERYTISMNRVAPPPADEYENDDTKAQARIITDSSVAEEVHSLPYHDTDWVALPVVAGGQYNVTMSSGSSIITLHVYTSNDSLITSRSVSTSDYVFPYSASKEDTIYYRVSSSYSIENYTFSMTALLPDEYENDNVRDSANTIEIDEVQYHTLTLSDTDWVSIGVDSGITYRVTSSAAFLHYIYLYEESSSSYDKSGTGSSCTLDYTATADQTLYLMVKFISTSTTYTGPYTISITSSQ